MVDIDIAGDTLQIRTFTLDMMVEHPAIVMVAKRGSGKSFICRAILYHYNKIPCGIIISETDLYSTFFGIFYPESFIFYKYKSDILQNVINRQKLMIAKAKKRKAETGKDLDTRCLVLMDDCLADAKSWVRDKPIQDLMFNGRHIKIMYILTMQYPLGVPPSMRINFDYIFLMMDDSFINQKKLYEQYAGCFPSFNAFREIFNELTKDFGAMVIINRGSKPSILEKIFYYKAPNYDGANESVKIGCRQFRMFHEKNYDKDWNTKEMQIDAEQFMMEKKKSGSKMNVKVVKTKDSEESSYKKKK